MKIVLASGSPSRKKIFASLKILFEVIESEIDEEKVKGQVKSPRQMVKRLAFKKAMVVVKKLKKQKRKNFLVIGADSTAAMRVKNKWRFFGKPKNKKEARDILWFLRGKRHQFFTGLAAISSLGRKWENVAISNVYFGNFSKNTLENVLKRGIWRERAGGYDIDKDKSRLIEKFEGSYSNILGMPMEKLGSILKEMGIKI
jgi:septum formation protein